MKYSKLKKLLIGRSISSKSPPNHRLSEFRVLIVRICNEYPKKDIYCELESDYERNAFIELCKLSLKFFNFFYIEVKHNSNGATKYSKPYVKTMDYINNQINITL